MAVATEVSSAQLNPALQPVKAMSGMMDALLVLRAAAAVGANGNTTAIDVEGGFLAEFVCFVSAVSGTAPTLAETLMASVNGGSNYFAISPTLILATALLYDAPTDTLGWISRPVWIPRPTGTNKTTKLRVNSVSGGSATPLVTVYEFIRPFGYGVDKGLEVLI